MTLVSSDNRYPIDLDRLPPGWTARKLGDVIKDIRPGFPSGRHNSEGLGVPHLRPMNIDREGRLNLSVVKSVPLDNPLRIRAGDVLFNNTNSPELVGKTTAFDREGDWAYSNHMTRLKPPPGIHPRFLAAQLHYLWSRGYFRTLCNNHVNQASVASSTLAERVPIVVPPQDEQRRIIAAIEEHITRLDAGVEDLQRARAKLKRHRAAVLKAACEGRLVPTEADLARAEGRDYEPADRLLDRILQERRASWEADQVVKMATNGKRATKDNRKSRYAEPRGPDSSQYPPLPEGWCWANIEQLTGYLRNGLSQKPTSSPPGFRILRINAVRPMRVDPAEVRFLEIPADEAAGYLIENGDLLFTRYNGSVELLGVAGMVRACTEPTLHPDKLIRVRTVLGAPLSCYCEIACNVGESRRHMESRARTTAGQTGISGSDIRAMPIPLPPLAEQARIVAEVERRLSLIDELEAAISANLKRADRLRQSVLKRAFEGKLVPQDPADEPAEVLLARITGEHRPAQAHLF